MNERYSKEVFEEVRVRWKKRYCKELKDDELVRGATVKRIVGLYEDYIASRDSRILSAVPSEDEIEGWYIEKYGQRGMK